MDFCRPSTGDQGRASSGQARRSPLGLDATQAADALYMLTGSETFRQLVMERGWSPDRFEEWLAYAIRRLVIAEAAG
jgi:hypothetical protein